MKRCLLLGTGSVLGAVTAWALWFPYIELVPSGRGDLLVPCAFTLAGASLIARHGRLREVARGVALGALGETLFFWWLFHDLAKGSRGL